MEYVRTIVIMAATISMGLAAGVFALFAHTIMPGLGRVDDRTFVSAFQAIDRAIINPWFLGATFLGALLFALLATIVSVGRITLPWIGAALILYSVTIAITFAVHLPLNDGIKKAGDSLQVTELRAVRTAFNERRWQRWNLARVITTTGAFGSLAWALVLHGRSN